jgi:hypothetical protein
MTRERNTRRHRSAARREHGLGGAALDVYTAAWLTRRFLRLAAAEARRTVRGWRRRVIRSG